MHVRARVVTPGIAKRKWRETWAGGPLKAFTDPIIRLQGTSTPSLPCVLRDSPKAIKERTENFWIRWEDRQGAAPLKYPIGLKIQQKLHEDLPKAASSVLVQMRTNCNGFRHFLSRRRVPGIESGMCECGTGRETAKHVVVHCPLSEGKEVLRKGRQGTIDYKWLTTDRHGAARLARWLISSGRLPQYQLAHNLLYG